MTKDELFVHMLTELEDMGNMCADCPSIETFRYVWRNSFSHLKIPRYNTLGSCGECLKFKIDMAEFRKNSPEYKNIKTALVAHLTQVRTERRQQIIRDQDAHQYPLDSWTITTDFMQDLYLPYLATRPKNWFAFSNTFLKV